MHRSSKEAKRKNPSRGQNLGSFSSAFSSSAFFSEIYRLEILAFFCLSFLAFFADAFTIRKKRHLPCRIREQSWWCVAFPFGFDDFNQQGDSQR